MYNASLAETETTVRWDGHRDVAVVWSNDPVEIKRLDALISRGLSGMKLVSEDSYGKRYEMLRSSVVLGRFKRKIDPERAKANTQRMKEYWEQKKAADGDRV